MSYLAFLTSKLTLQTLGAVIVTLVTWTSGIFIVMALCERAGGASLARYRSREVLHDLFYRIFYSSGLFRVLLLLPVAIFLSRWLAVPQLANLAAAPLVLAVPASLIVSDCCAYWTHRFQHSRWWWPFHRVHHSQTNLTFLTTYRHHPLDMLLEEGVSLILVVIGAPTFTWLPYRLLSTFQAAASHAELNWSYGPVGRLFVSPVFHSIHHAEDRAEHDRNFGALLSIWDRIWGTASAREVRPAATGVAGYVAPDSWAMQLAEPIVEILRPGRDTQKRRDG